MRTRSYVVVGGTSGIGLEICRALATRGDHVILTGRDAERTRDIAATIDANAVGLGLDLSDPASIADALAGVGAIDGLVLSGVERDGNSVRDFDIDRASRTATIKLIGYAETVHILADRIVPSAESGIVMFGGISRHRPYPGSLTISTVNAGVEGLTAALSLELAPIRTNVLHPGIIGDSPFWADKEGALRGYRDRTPGGELATMANIVDATLFLLDNSGISAQALNVDRATQVM